MPVAVVCGLLGLLVGALAHAAAARFPWPPGRGQGSGVLTRTRPVAVRMPVLEVGTAALFALTAERFGLSWELPAFLALAGAGVLLAVIDLQHHLLPNRVVLPALGAGALLLTLAAAATGDWTALSRAGLGAVSLFAVFLALALISPAGLGMGDVKLAAVLGLHLGWLGWTTVVLGAAAAFVVQAVLALVLLAARRIGPKAELPFGPALLIGAALAVHLTT